MWNKKSGSWSVYEEKDKKKYTYNDEVIDQTLVRRIEYRIGMRKRGMKEDDPDESPDILPPLSHKQLVQFMKL